MLGVVRKILLSILFVVVSNTLMASAQEAAMVDSTNLKITDGRGDARPHVDSGVDVAQSITHMQTPDTPETGDNEFGAWGGGSFDSPTLIGTAEDARLAIAALRYARVVVAGNGLALKYTIDAVPASVLSYQSFIAVPNGPPVFNYRIEQSRKSAYGAGLAPIGLQLNFARRRRVQPFMGGSLGFLYFGEPVPDNRSRIFPDERGGQFNYTADFGGGVQVFTSSRRALTFGYKYHHISNGFRAPVNPGFDSNLFYAGFSIFK